MAFLCLQTLVCYSRRSCWPAVTQQQEIPFVSEGAAAGAKIRLLLLTTRKSLLLVEVSSDGKREDHFNNQLLNSRWPQFPKELYKDNKLNNVWLWVCFQCQNCNESFQRMQMWSFGPDVEPVTWTVSPCKDRELLLTLLEVLCIS